jgi:hypothetical protein
MATLNYQRTGARKPFSMAAWDRDATCRRRQRNNFSDAALIAGARLKDRCSPKKPDVNPSFRHFRVLAALLTFLLNVPI